MVILFYVLSFKPLQNGAVLRRTFLCVATTAFCSGFKPLQNGAVLRRYVLYIR